MDSKTCPKCHTIKTLDCFYKDGKRTDGLTSWCMRCLREYAHRYAQTEAGKEAVKRRYNRYYAQDPTKMKARSKARHEIRVGRLIRPELCPKCNRKLPLQAHHEDYSKPLDVQFFCFACHKDHHGWLKDRTLLGEGEVDGSR